MAMKKFQYFPKVLGASFVLALCVVGLSEMSQSHLLASVSVEVIPDKGILASKFETGKFDFVDILKYGMYLIKIMGVLAGVIYMFVNIIAGIKYITGSISGDEEDAKNMMVNGIMGFALAIFSWIMVDILLTLVT